jgi:hypothetical protein
MTEYQWTSEKPISAGWYWFRGLAHEADHFIVQVDMVGQFQWPDGGFQEVTLAKGEWAGPIQLAWREGVGPLEAFPAPGTRTM